MNKISFTKQYFLNLFYDSHFLSGTNELKVYVSKTLTSLPAHDEKNLL